MGSIRTVFIEEARELDEDMAAAADQRRDKNIPKPPKCPLCKEYVLGDLRMHVWRLHTGQPSTPKEAEA